ncbi:MAG: alpha/beta fold hydrolase [Rubrivivax sp.]|nr:alpha/beta fold hydrolase [Rubrivivax sp.]
MLARLQQALTLGALLLAAGWAWLASRSGHPGWAVAGVLLVIGGYALVLGLEFLLLHRVHGDDPTPRARPRQLLRAWCGEVLSAPAVFCWRQPFFSRRWPDRVPADSLGHRGVVLVHGFVCNRGLWNPWLAKLQAQQVPFIAVDLEPVFGSIDAYSHVIEAAVQRLEKATGQAPVIVAHSMGGLAVRRWWVEHGNDRRVHRAITIGTPHRGTWLARFALSANGRQMQPESEWLRSIAARETAARATHFTCFYSHCDNIVFPPIAATLAGADNRHLAAVAHVHMADRPEPWQELQRWLQTPATESKLKAEPRPEAEVKPAVRPAAKPKPEPEAEAEPEPAP